jgi:hypothetical protein
MAVAVLVALLGGSAVAGPKEDADKAAKAAMESYDLMDYGAAKTSLQKAIGTATKAKLDKDPVVAKLHLYLGIATFADGDADGAKKAFIAAVKIDGKIQIEAAYKSPELTKLLETARTEAGGSSTPTGPTEPSDGVDCASVKGLQFKEPDGGKGGVAQPIEAYLAADVTAVRVSVMYRSEGATEFVESKLAKSGGCKYTGSIPGTALKGSILHYYVAAFDANNRPISGATAGNARTPNLLEVAAGTGGDVEDPIKGPKGGGGGAVGSGGGISSGGTVVSKPTRVFLAIVGGTGFGYVTGVTEANNEVQTCCVGNSLVVLTPELGYYINQQLSIGLAARIGFPVGANVDPPNAQHSTIAPAAMLRVRYALSHTGEGLRVMGQLGGGVMRNTIKLQMQSNGGDTDIVAQGPLLIGAGIGFMKKLSNNIAFMADVSALAGIAVVDKLGTARLNSGVGGDVSLGVAVGF